MNLAVNALLPEGKHPDASLISPNVFVQFTANDNNNMSVTFLQSNAGYANRMGYVKINSAGTSNPSYAVQRTNSNSGAGCLSAGDTWQFGQFKADDMLVFFLDANSNSAYRYWSYFPPGAGLTNPSADVSTCGSPGCTHSAWAYLSEFDLTIFGWEDQSLGDADYNDLVFYLTLQGSGYYNQVPPYSNGTILICNNNTIVSWNSFTDVNCQSWGLLESATSSGSCLTYMAIPAGWTWAPDDATSRNIILASAAQWAYTGSTTCYLLKVSPTTGAGYNVSGGALQSCDASVRYITPGGATINPGSVTATTPLCYNTECTARYVLKSISQSVACSAVTRCSAGVVNTALSSTPTNFSSGVVTIPDSVTAYLATGSPAGNMAVSAQMQLTGTDLSTPKVDVVVLTDFFVDQTGSGQGQRSYIDNSWNSVSSSFRSLNLNVQFATVNFVPTSNAAGASYTLSSDYTFQAAALSYPNSAFHRISCGSSSAAQLTRGRNLISAINNVATSSALNWRSDSYRIIWVHTLCALPADGVSSSSSVTMQSIQQNTGIVPIIANGGTGSSTPTFTSNAPWTYSWYFSGSSVTWDAPFRTYAYTPFRGAYLVTTLVKTFQVVAAQGDTNWLTGIPASPVSLNPAGYAAINYNIAWPSDVPATTTQLYYRASVQVIGRDTVSYLIYFNHAPTLSSYSTSVPTTSSSITFVMQPSDLDQGNRLNLVIVTGPNASNGGTLTTSTGTTVTTGSVLDVNVFTLTYTPGPRTADYTESIVIAADDGCAQTQATVTISVPKVNRAPVAQNFAISMTEDDLASASFAFTSPAISDPDGNPLQVFLSAAAYVTSGTVRAGAIGTSASGGTTYTAGSFLPQNSGLFYRLTATNSLTGYGVIVVPFQAFDGSLYSNTAFLTINVNHRNHPPSISAVTAVSNRVGAIATWTISVTDVDYGYPGETAQIQIVGANWATPASGNAFTISNNQGSNAFNFAGATTPSAGSPATFSTASGYAPGSNVTFSGSTVTFTGFQWQAPATGGQPAQSITIRAIDASSGESTPATITFSLTDNNAPVWRQFPGVMGDANTFQGAIFNDLYFSAYDADGQPQMEKLSFKVISVPANGKFYAKNYDTGVASTTALAVGDTLNVGTANPYARYNNTGSGVADFRLQYVGKSDYWGTDIIQFSVTDNTTLSASGYGSAQITTQRRPTPPVSTNINVQGYEEAWTAFAIPAQSTNDITSPVRIVLESVNFTGSFVQFDGSSNATWTAGSNSTLSVTNGGSIVGYLRGDIGYFGNPVGSFSYRVYEPATELLSTIVYNATITIVHVNHPPTSVSQTSRIKKREPLTLRLPASDPDADDGDATLDAVIISVSPGNGGPPLYFDEAMQDPVTSASISAGRRLVDRTFYYLCDDLYDKQNPMMLYQFRIYDKQNASSDPYNGYIYVAPAGDAPQPITNVTTTPQETPVPMSLASDVITESGRTPTVAITSLPGKGTFSYCTDTGVCTQFTTSTTLPFTLPGTTGRVVYTPRPFDWGTSFTSFTYTMTDPDTNAVGTYTMVIDVTHVNKPPSIFAANFLTSAESTTGIIINESEWRNFDWYVNDVDDLPSNLTTMVRVTFYTTQGFSIYSCAFTAGDWNSSTCAFDTAADVPMAVRADFAKNARVTFQAYETVTTDCPDYNTLKERYGSTSRNCESHFRFAFVPTPLASYTPYVTISWTATDGLAAESTTISALIYVKSVNNAPTIWAPAQVVGAAGITNPFLRDTSPTSPTFNNPITVADVDSASNIEQMTFEVVSGVGNFIFPAAASCTNNAANTTVVCNDRINAFNQWLPDVRFNITSGDRATLRFTVDDLGNSGDWRPSPHLTANATTVVVVSAAVTTPRGNSSTLAIAVGVAAGAGLLLLGALGFFLRNAVSPPDEDYFSAATAPISAAPQSPLYQAQNSEHMSPLYKGTA